MKHILEPFNPLQAFNPCLTRKKNLISFSILKVFCSIHQRDDRIGTINPFILSSEQIRML